MKRSSAERERVLEAKIALVVFGVLANPAIRSSQTRENSVISRNDFPALFRRSNRSNARLCCSVGSVQLSAVVTS